MNRHRWSGAQVMSALDIYSDTSAEALRLEERSHLLFVPGGVGFIAGLVVALATRHPEVANKLTMLQENATSAAGYITACLGLTAMVFGLRDSSQALGIRKAVLGSPPLPPLPPEFTPDPITPLQAASLDGLADSPHWLD